MGQSRRKSREQMLQVCGWAALKSGAVNVVGMLQFPPSLVLVCRGELPAPARETGLGKAQTCC